MPAIRMAVRLAAAAAVLSVAAGCGGAPASREPDIMWTSSLERTEQQPEEGGEGEIRLVRSNRIDTDRKPARTEPDYSGNTVHTITPSYGSAIRRKQSQNRDTVGWLTIPGTRISSVVVANPERLEDNNYYLQRSFNGQADRNGSFCTDFRVRTGNRSQISRNTVIYGHSWSDNPNGELFDQLKRYRNADFAREHPYIYYSTAEEDMVWEVFAVFDAVVDFPYIAPNLTKDYLAEILDVVEDASLYHYDVSVGADDKVLTLSTCTYAVEGHSSLPYPNQYRFVVMARLCSPGEEVKEEAVFRRNAYPLSPDEMQEMVDDGVLRNFTYGSDTD